MSVSAVWQELEPGDAAHYREGIAALTGDRFAVLRLLGTGGGGAVLLAFDRTTKTRVALKCLGPDSKGSLENRERFRREALIASQLEHANVVPCFEFLYRGSFAMAVMRYIPGHSLAERVASGRKFGVDEALGILAPLADALAHTHARGVIHRDVKPANILLNEGDDWPFLTDFGIATLHTSEQSRAEVQKGYGTPAYMSPEQVLGEWDADHRTDIYSLGVVAFQLLTGRLPFEADTSLAQAALRTVREAPSIRSIAPEVPAALAAIVEKCLARNPNRRWKNAALLHSALRRVQDHKVTTPLEWAKEVVASWTLRPAPVRRLARIA
ncbi:MAG TPA: serine/threonine-protein kinase [Gemmatimonadales bacterium]|nr:serine/threonine-protein kinase [Gemmatimonadales bacterium]